MKKAILFSFLAALVLPFQACNNNPSKTETDSVAAAQDSNADMNNDVKDDDSDFMVKAANGGMMEVEAGKLAQQNGASQEIKDFGARMVADHTKAGDELKGLADAKNVVLPSVLGDEEQKHLDEMSKLKGAEFDKHYMDMMVNDHNKTVDMFEDAANSSKDADIKTWASNTLPVLKDHQAAAKALDSKIK